VKPWILSASTRSCWPSADSRGTARTGTPTTAPLRAVPKQPENSMNISYRWPLRLASLAACLLFWQIAANKRLDLGLIAFTYVPTPASVLDAAWHLLQSSKLADHLSSSLGRVFTGYVTAAVAGVQIGRASCRKEGRWRGTAEQLSRKEEKRTCGE